MITILIDLLLFYNVLSISIHIEMEILSVFFRQTDTAVLNPVISPKLGMARFISTS